MPSKLILSLLLIFLISSSLAWDLEVEDHVKPFMKIVYPENITYNVSVTHLSYIYSERNPGYCWISMNDGWLNSSETPMGYNFSFRNATNQITLFCNDTSGNQNSVKISFSTPESMLPKPSREELCNLSRAFLISYDASNKAEAYKMIKLYAVENNLDISYTDFALYIDDYKTLCKEFNYTSKNLNKIIIIAIAAGVIAAIAGFYFFVRRMLSNSYYDVEFA